jgi:hypothetical protein
LLLITTSLPAQEEQHEIVTSDIDNFWKAYDVIVATHDMIAQYNALENLFLSKGTPGLKALMGARSYTAKSYIDAIKRYPRFWKSVRPNTLKAKTIAKEIYADIQKLRLLYPELKPAKIYFTIGALRSNGTTSETMVLIGSELAMADPLTVTDEFPQSSSHLRPYFNSDPSKNIVFLNVHEYVHTQQKTTIGNCLLAQTVIEGVAEFAAETASGKKSGLPALQFGKESAKRVSDAFAAQMLNPFNGFWISSDEQNEFNTRDLGYYVGYAICEKFYHNSSDKQSAIKTMIELDYNDQNALWKFVDDTGFFPKSVAGYHKIFENERPTVTKIMQFSNGSSSIDPKLTEITIEFSHPMDGRFRNFEYGPLGEQNVLRVKSFKGMSADNKSATFEIELIPNQRYQLVVGERFRSTGNNVLALRPYLIDFTTANN